MKKEFHLENFATTNSTYLLTSYAFFITKKTQQNNILKNIHEIIILALIPYPLALMAPPNL